MGIYNACWRELDFQTAWKGYLKGSNFLGRPDFLARLSHFVTAEPMAHEYRYGVYRVTPTFHWHFANTLGASSGFFRLPPLHHILAVWEANGGAQLPAEKIR
ncbi:hypothetical protein [Microbulbifer sp. THAF38]|uniref:hypothetical protein n=1 Tax=Microbulbifer sp. THAF38 TaxID=2587856 RepID=UPI001268C316|nr:hypothetical protein [Microbulbifer sp. THAF38]